MKLVLTKYMPTYTWFINNEIEAISRQIGLNEP